MPVDKQKMNCCEKLSKRSLIALNSICMLSALIAIIGGVVVKINLGSYLNHLAVGNLKTATEFLATAPIVFIILGCFITVISLLGCCGAHLENLFLLKVYKVTLLLVLSALAVTAALTFTFKSSVQQALFIALTNFFHTYNNTREVMDLIQTNIDCCGVNSSLDWNYNDIWKERAQEISDRDNLILGTSPVPDSCCIDIEAGCGLANSAEDVSTGIYTDGCAGKFWNYLSANGDTIGISGLVVAAILLCSIVFTCFVINYVDESGDFVI
ncbi:CD63 antigen-like [Clavelina lepadiformis]|uniref:CD63 antigen-like n=1 Tax=Clavelina lepadiformis TaxID=159417 RepID=UPI004041924E